MDTETSTELSRSPTSITITTPQYRVTISFEIEKDSSFYQAALDHFSRALSLVERERPSIMINPTGSMDEESLRDFQARLAKTTISRYNRSQSSSEPAP